jgi:hypothetical protein
MICVQNHYSRNTNDLEKRIIETSDGFDYKIFTDSTDYYKDRRSPYRYMGIAQNFLNMMREKTDNPYKIIIHDDVSIHKNLFKNIRYVMPYSDAGLTCFYNPTNNFYKNAFEKNFSVVASYSKFWMQCVAIKTEWGYEFAEWIDKNTIVGHLCEDQMISTYLGITNQLAKIVIPSFVQHEGYDKSIFKNPASIQGNKRNSFSYDPDFDPKSIDWAYQFANPLIDKTKLIHNTI